MRTDFKLVGLSAGKRFTVEYGKEDLFWADSALPPDRYDALFKWAKESGDFWKTGWIVEIEHDGFYADGSPKKPVAVGIREGSLVPIQLTQGLVI